jgi:glucose/arabinose dehydrogenase
MATTLSAFCQNAAIANAAIHSGFCAGTIPVKVEQARTIHSISKNSFIYLDRSTNPPSARFVSKLFDNDNKDHVSSEWITKTIAQMDGLNHGLTIFNNSIYASSAKVVWKWPYIGKNFTIVGEPTQIISNMNDDGSGGTSGGNHQTRTLLINRRGTMYISVGSVGNVDRNSFRSRIRRFQLPFNGTTPVNFVTGEVFADGVRNEVGLTFDSFGVVWGVENGADQLYRQDLGGDISKDNPAERLHRFMPTNSVLQSRSRHYGYPYCFNEYNLPNTGLGQGTFWAWPDFLASGRMTDEQCRKRMTKPALAMQAHSAPLGVVFYRYRRIRPSYCANIIPFPQTMNHYAFIAFHGSWNRDIPTGYKVVYVPITFNQTTGRIISIAKQPIDLLKHKAPNAQWEDGFRPVDVSFDECGRLLVSSDGSGGEGAKIVRIDATSTTLLPP